VETKSSGCVMNGFCMNKTTKYSSQWESSSYAEVSINKNSSNIERLTHEKSRKTFQTEDDEGV
jgi:hypothetical protein